MERSKTVILIGEQFDIHLLQVAFEIERTYSNNTQVYIFDPYVSEFNWNITNQKTQGAFYICSGLYKEGIEIPFDRITSVLYRWKVHPLQSWKNNNEKVVDEFRLAEWRQVLSSLPYLMGDQVLWVNPPYSLGRIHAKPAQLQLAKEIGFSLPHTIITNSSDAILEQSWVKNSSNIIFKSLTPFLTPKVGLYTTQISTQKIYEKKANIGIAPGIFQERCRKSFELRVTVVGNEVFSAKINSSKYDMTTVDWRQCQDHSDTSLFSVFELPKTIKQKLLNYHHKSGLLFGAYDMIVTEKEGDKNNNNDDNSMNNIHPDLEKYDYIFLEVNPGGQWLWMEYLYPKQFPISAAVGRLLTGSPPNESLSTPCVDHHLFGKALEDHFIAVSSSTSHSANNKIVLHFEGFQLPINPSDFFAESHDWSKQEQEVFELIKNRLRVTVADVATTSTDKTTTSTTIATNQNSKEYNILDVGAAGGWVSKAIMQIANQYKQNNVTTSINVYSIDSDPTVCHLLEMQDLPHVICCDIFKYTPPKKEMFTIVLLLGNSLCMVESRHGLALFLSKIRDWLTHDGTIIIHSSPPIGVPESSSAHWEYDIQNNATTIATTTESRIHMSPSFKIFQIDEDNLFHIAKRVGWSGEVIAREDNTYFAVLQKLT